MNEQGLQARGWVDISGGYKGEEHGILSGFSASYVEAQPQQEIPVSFYYRDSQTGDNANSTRVVVDMIARWNYERIANNSYKVTTEAWLTGIRRDDKRGNVPCCGGQIPSRHIQVYDASGKIVWGPKETNISLVEQIMSGKVYLGKREYILKPQTATSGNELMCHFFNYTTGYWSPQKDDPQYRDDMYMGVQFYNPLPLECDPPVMISSTQTEDICENAIEACVKFGPCSCDGMGLVFQYKFNNDSWENAIARWQYRELNASSTSPMTICLPGLPPTNHTNQPMIFNWRAKYVPITSDMPETEWVYGSMQMLFILAPHETVPDIDPTECMMLGRGDLIDKYNQEVCYNEYSCADMSVTNPNRDKDVAACKKVNGVLDTQTKGGIA